MRARPRHAAFVLAAALALAGCGSAPNRLQGSLSDQYSLDFDTVDAQLVGGYLVVSYVRTATMAKTLKLTVELTGYQVVAGAEIDLAAKAPSGSPRGTFSRVDATTINLPFSSGGITLDAVPAAGAHLGGHFHATFTMPAGRALDGDFSVDKVGP
jgi:hypothetical protein